MFVLSKGSIKQQLASGLAAALLLSGVSAANAPAQTAAETSENKSAEAIASSDALTDSESVQPGAELAPSLSEGILVHAHEIDGRQAATLYVKDLPVLTFIGTEVHSLSNSSDAVALAISDTSGAALDVSAAPVGGLLDPELEADPVLRATTLGSQLNPDAIDAESISVRWNEDTEGYIVTLADDDLIALDSRTILADTTEDAAEDALQVTNRLRRLLGDAEPVSEIEGLPEPVVEVAPAQTVAIVSSNVGGASWYGPGFHGRLSANGETFNQYAMTAAHRTLPFGTNVLVTNLYNGRQVTVRINDRGPYAGDRIIDLSQGAAEVIGLIDSGVGTVQVDVLGY
ncbi:MAG: septal ring lytic transglycosylase RlpA family protein [Cyanobacteria bacterium J06598_3]